MVSLIIIITLIVVGYMTGQWSEKRHYKSIIEREKKLQNLPVISSQWKNEIDYDQEARLWSGGVVVASDYFKMFVAGLRNLVGGRMRSYESLIDRGRREAILRMKERAQKWGADRIVNMRIETAVIGSTSGGRKGGLACIEIYAYGTALRKKRSEQNEIHS